MKILVTGAKGFVGKNLCSQLKNIKEGKAKCYGNLVIEEVFEFDLDSTPEQLDEWCKDCDFVFNLAGVNRPQDPKDFMEGNFGFASVLLNTLKKHRNKATVMLLVLLRLLYQNALATLSTVVVKRQVKTSFSTMVKRMM